MNRERIYFIVFLLVILKLTSVFTQVYTVKNMDTLEGDLKNILIKNLPKDGPGGIVGVFMNGKAIAKVSYGYENLTTKTLITENTIFDLASCSKHITAAGILLLKQENKINLNDDIKKWLPEFNNFSSIRPIIIQDLVWMIDGFKDFNGLIPEGKGATNTNEDNAKMLAETQTKFPVGTSWAYSNSAYMLLGLIIKRASKVSFSSYLSDKIFTPLGMTNSRGLDKLKDFVYAQGYKKNNASGSYEPIREETPFSYGDGNIFTTMNDLEKWDNALNQKTILNEDSLKLAYTNGKQDSGKINEYGFGWEVKEGGTIVTHDGSWFGSSTLITRYLNKGLTVAFFSNIDSYEVGKVGDEVGSLMLNRLEQNSKTSSSKVLTVYLIALIILNIINFI